jgi:hypothetical protein
MKCQRDLNVVIVSFSTFLVTGTISNTSSVLHSVPQVESQVLAAGSIDISEKDRSQLIGNGAYDLTRHLDHCSLRSCAFPWSRHLSDFGERSSDRQLGPRHHH